jgi:hypothetical protein
MEGNEITFIFKQDNIGFHKIILNKVEELQP